MKPWALYIRVSTVRQADEGISLQAQEAACLAYARERGWSVPADLIITDGGMTATNANRPGYQRLLQLVRAGEIAGIIGTKFNRISRNLDELRSLIRLVNERNVHLVAVSMQIDTTTPIGRMVIGILGTVDEYFSEDNGDQTSRAMQFLMSKGYFVGGMVPPGCEVELVEDGKRRRLRRGPDAETVSQAWSWVLAGASLLDVAVRFHEAGLKAPHHRGSAPRWTPSSVRNLLLSPKVVGVLVEAPIQAMVRATLAERGRPMRRGKDRAPGSRAKVPSPLAGILRCPTCDASCVQVTATGHGGAYRYFRCCGRVKGACRQKDLRCEPLEAAVIEAVGKAVQPGGEYHDLIRAGIEDARSHVEAARIERGRLTAERDQLAARVDELTLQTQIGTQVWERAMKAVGVQLTRIERRLGELAGTISAAEVDQASTELVLSEIAAGAAGLATDTLEGQARTLRILVASVRMKGEDHVILDLYEPGPAHEGGSGSWTTHQKLGGKHGERTVRVVVRARIGPPRRKPRGRPGQPYPSHHLHP